MYKISDLDEANQILNNFRATSPGTYKLERIVEAMHYLGNPQDNFKTIHIAGTSGKTSTAHYAAVLLQQAKFKVGLTVSPHVDSVKERAQINFEVLSDQQYCQKLSQFLNLIEASKIQLSYFEVLVAFAYWLFSEEQVDYAVVEVGLGGLLDGTNVINRADKVCVITDIGLDHTEVLGNTLAEIAAQKAGIIKAGNKVYVQEQADEVMQVIEQQCESVGASLKKVEFKDLNTDLPSFQKRNFNLAVNAVKGVAELSGEHINAVSGISIPARMEEFKYGGKTVIIDGSHNDQKTAALVRGYKDIYGDASPLLVVAFGDNKANSLRLSLKNLRELSDQIIITAFKGGQDNHRSSIGPAVIENECKAVGFKDIKVIANAADAFKSALESDREQVLITGSYYLLNQIRPLVLDKR